MVQEITSKQPLFLNSILFNHSLLMFGWCFTAQCTTQCFPLYQFFILGKHETVLQSQKKQKKTTQNIKVKENQMRKQCFGGLKLGGLARCQVLCDGGSQLHHVCLEKLRHSTTLNETLLVLDPVHPDTPSFPTASSATDSRTFVKSQPRRRKCPHAEKYSASW